MTITARYAATCATCRKTITPGQQIEWSKGAPVRHTSCGSAPIARPGVSRPAPRKSSGFPPVRGCGQCARLGKMCPTCYHDEYDM